VSSRERWIGLSLAFIGVTVCLVGLIGFVWTISSNNLPWSPDQSAREYYLEVGRAYSHGFLTGFFLCFFLVFGATAVAAWWNLVRDRRGTEAAHPVRPGLHVIPGGRSPGTAGSDPTRSDRESHHRK
jgi:hypothetical protein